jgi:hypothetical protein
MANWKIPPIAKVYEALSAVADKRVKLKSDFRVYGMTHNIF